MHPEAPEKTVSFNVVDVLQKLPLEDIKIIADEAAFPYTVAIANITGDLNTGMIIRTASVFAARKVFIFGRRKYDRRSTVGAHHYIDIEAYPNAPDEHAPFNWENMLQIIRVNGYTPVLIEQCGAPLGSMDHLPTPPPCLVFGPEDTGIPEDICSTELCYSIPQPGILRSLNVAVAAGIVMQHFAAHYLAAAK